VLSIVIAVYVQQTGILLTLAFDLMLACLVVPFILGLVWRRGTGVAAVAAMVVGLVVRLVLFALTPTMYGVENTILYIPNDLVGAAFDGWPTFIAFAASIATYVAVSLVTAPAQLRGLDIAVAQDVDDALSVPAQRSELDPV
jgi:solute:Na+ symporter, SSS family